MASGPISLSSFIGKQIQAKIPAFRNNVVTVTLRGVEAGGIWIESADFMESMFEGTQYKMTPRSVLLFVPFAQILAIYDFGGGGPWISEKVAE
jgi:hypothetical protein